MAVSIIRTNERIVRESLTEALRLINYAPPNKRIIIKPNVAGAMSVDTAVVTDFIVVDAVVDYFRKFTADICVAEGSSIGYDTIDAFEESGYGKWARKKGVDLIDLRQEETCDIDWKYGKIKIPRIVLESEFVNVPKLKTHNQTGVTICMKNLKGIIGDEDKKMFHRKGLMEPITALAEAVRPKLNIVDAINAMEGEGPGRSGKKKRMELILAGKDLMEVDRVCLEIIGFDTSEAPYIPDISFSTKGVPIDEIKTNFLRPTGHYQKLNCHMWMGNTCSGCVFQVADAMYSLKRRPLKALAFMTKNLKVPMHLVTGSGLKLNIKGGKIICIGNCSARTAELMGIDYIRGCPPSYKDILRRL